MAMYIPTLIYSLYEASRNVATPSGGLLMFSSRGHLAALERAFVIDWTTCSTTTQKFRSAVKEQQC